MEDYPLHPQVQHLLNLPQHEQRSPEWFEQRKNRLTSSDVDSVLGTNKYNKPDDILFKKCGIAPPFTGNEATRHGQKYEDEAIEHYCRIHGKKSYSFGLLPHPTVEWLGGSPDDITHDGVVIEVKCPLRRKIVMGVIPEHYINQIKMNMEICDLDKGVFIEYRPAHMCPDNEMILNIVHLERDKQWFESVLPTLDSFWKEVLYYREKGIEEHPDYVYHYNRCKPKKIITFEEKKSLFVDDEEETKSLFVECSSDSGEE